MIMIFSRKNRREFFESLGVYSPRLAAVASIPADPGSSPWQAPESRERDWIPPYRVWGRLSQARNEILYPAACRGVLHFAWRFWEAIQECWTRETAVLIACSCWARAEMASSMETAQNRTRSPGLTCPRRGRSAEMTVAIFL
jgi:hypothetical protein